MSIDISVKTAVLLAAKAQEQGLSIDAFLERILKDAGYLPASAANGEAQQGRVGAFPNPFAPNQGSHPPTAQIQDKDTR